MKKILFLLLFLPILAEAQSKYTISLPNVSAGSGGGGGGNSSFEYGTYVPTFTIVSGPLSSLTPIGRWSYLKTDSSIIISGRTTVVTSGSGNRTITFSVPSILNNFTSLSIVDFGIFTDISVTSNANSFPFDPINGTKTIQVTMNSQSAATRTNHLICIFKIP